MTSRDAPLDPTAGARPREDAATVGPLSPSMPNEGLNTALLALHAIVMRIGWIFKTESVIIPAFLDSISGAAWIRGLLPVLNRAGQSVPAFLLARSLKLTHRKKWVLVLSSLGAGLAYLLLAWLFLSPQPGLVVTFLVLYAIFFAFAGLGGVAAGTLQGKLVPARRRGRLLAASTFGGTVPAVILAWWLLPGWLQEPSPAYSMIFLFAGTCFVLAGALVVALREPPDRHTEAALGVFDQLRGAWQILRENPDYRRLVIVSALFSSSIMVFPHYQALARERLDLVGANLMVWVVVQNVAMGLTSLVIGPIADRFGNRLTLRLLVFAAAVIPLLAIGLTYLPADVGPRLFPLVFAGIGLIPIGFRVLTNYVLEISPAEDHPRYLSLSQLCTAAVFVASPGLGVLVDVAGFDSVLILQAIAMCVGGFLTFRLVEPRHL